MMWETLVMGFVEAVSAVLGGLYSLVPAVPSWLDTGALDTVVDSLAGLSHWLPVSYALQVAGSVVTAYLTAGAVGLGRAALSHVTGGGGAS